MTLRQNIRRALMTPCRSRHSVTNPVTNVFMLERLAAEIHLSHELCKQLAKITNPKKMEAK